ncbi:ATP-binding cassette domain-containing protein [Leucobacter sp. GX24907]
MRVARMRGMRMRRRISPALLWGAVLFGTILLLALFAPLIAPHSPSAQNLSGGLQPPSAAHWFGTDQLGRDVLSRVLFAARTDLRIAIAAAIAPFVTGVLVGLIAGYFGGPVRWVASRVIDTVIAFPFYVIVIAIVFAVGAGESGIIVAFALVGWVGYARVVAATVAALCDAGWVQAARGAGLSHARVLLRHMLPNVLPQAVVLLATEIVLIMVAIVTLGYLGLGVQPPTPDWGTMISDGQQFVTTHWWLSALPGLAVVVTGISLSLLGDGVGDALRVAGPARSVSRPRVGTRHLRSGSRHSPRRRSRPRGNASQSVAIRASEQQIAPHCSAVGEIRIRNLRIEARDAVVDAAPLVDGVNLDVQPGEAVGIVGESGSGKSLTLRAVLGMLPTGTVVAEGSSVAVGGSAGMVFQDPLTALDPLTRVGAQLVEVIRATDARRARTGMPARSGASAQSGAPAQMGPTARTGARARSERSTQARARALLRRVHLASGGGEERRIFRSYPHELSGGQRQRVVIALALAAEPAVLLCDEPTTALDVTVQRQVLDLLDELRSEDGLTLLFVSHDLAVVASVCSRIAVMRAGRIVEQGDTQLVLGTPDSEYTQRLLEAVPRLPELPGEAVLPGETALPDETVPSSNTELPSASVSPRPLVLRVRNLSVRYGPAIGVASATFDLAEGEALGIVGESGSGKTTLARALIGQLPAGGEIRFGSQDPGEILLTRRRTREQRRLLQLVPQDPYSSLDPRMTVGQTIGEVLRVHRLVPREAVKSRISTLLQTVRLDPEIARAYPHELSGGQRQRVALARALAVEPRVLVADEPTSALDVSVQAAIIDLLRELRRELGLTLVLISHDLAVVHEVCDRVLVMRGGEVVEQGGRELFRRPREEYTRALLTSVPRI